MASGSKVGGAYLEVHEDGYGAGPSNRECPLNSSYMGPTAETLSNLFGKKFGP